MVSEFFAWLIKVQYITPTTQNETYYLGNYEKIVANGQTKEIYYIGAENGLFAVMIRTGNTQQLYYTFTDNLGSVLELIQPSGVIAESYSFDAWGRRRNPANWSYTNITNPTILTRGFTGHEHLDEFGLINMNARLYDPYIARMLGPDKYVQDPANAQNYNRYSYCWNNPLKYTDPDGNIIFTALAVATGQWWALPMAIGADVGMWSGGTMANGGEMNPFKWNYDAKTLGYMAGGALVGAASGGAAGAVATSGMVGAKTAAIVTGSFVNSVGTHIYTGGQTDVSISFGFGSYNLTTGQARGIWNWGDLSTGEKIGYGLGTLANVSDILAGSSPGEVQLNTEKSDAIGHSALTNVGEKNPYNSLVSVGPDPGGKWIFNPFKFKNGTNNWKNYVNSEDYVMKVGVKGVNLKTITKYGAYLNKGVNYNLYFSSCVNHTARALTLAGVPTIGIHPFLLHSQMVLRSIGVRPMLYSYHLYQY